MIFVIEDKDMIKVSVVIPVHNGAKYIGKCVNGILNQSLKDIEVVLVENFSNDNSLNICNKLAKKDSRVSVFQSFDKGTSFARKKGVLECKGKYITFSDQDDRYINKYALENMYNEIVKNESQICEFGHYKEYNPLFKKKVEKSSNIYTGKEIFNEGLKGALGIGNNFSTTVWNKIYDADLVKHSVVNIDKGLFFAEDEYLNYHCFANDSLNRISTSEKCFYCWNVGVGFSSSNDSELALLSDYDKIKPTINEKLKELNLDEILWTYNLETVYFCRSIIISLISKNEDKNKIFDIIDRIFKSESFILASDYFKSYTEREKVWDELNKLATVRDKQEFYNLCESGVVNNNENFLKKIIKTVTVRK